ncbi:securin [Eucyclogobius newberryi]|uniref:securin n=1 Tax=Eucyclogobius newberryi TaxID=166745 RepID=UPI003B5B06F7
MSSILFDQENACPNPTGLKPRLQSASGKVLKTSAGAKNVQGLIQPGRKALGTVNKVLNSTPSIHVHKQLKPQETVVKVTQNKSDKYPDIEKFIPYDPLDFEKYSVPEDLLPLSMLALPGLAQLPQACVPEESQVFIPFDLSPVKMPNLLGCSKLDDFLHTLDKLTVELPPESS